MTIKQLALNARVSVDELDKVARLHPNWTVETAERCRFIMKAVDGTYHGVVDFRLGGITLVEKKDG